MDAKYQKYYDVLKGKDYSSYATTYKSTMTDVKSKISSTESTLSSSRWTEKGLDLIKKSVIPSLKSQTESISTALDSLSTACSKISTLTTELGNLESLCEEYDNAKQAYNNASEENKASKRTYMNNCQQKVTDKESAIDSLISDINGISVDISDESATFTKHMDDLKEYNSLANLKAEFVGSLNDRDKYYIDPEYAHKAKPLEVFDNTTGEIYHEGDSLTMKPGETRVLTVKLPYCAGHITKLVRTTSDGNGTYRSGTVASAKSDVDPDPNNVEYVNYQYNHYPSDESLLATTYYDWIVTANAEGKCVISQTCEYKVEENSGTPKAMIDLTLNVENG